MTYSGRASRGISRSAAAKTAMMADDEHERPPPQPRSGGENRERHDQRGPLPDGTQALLHVEHALAIDAVSAEPGARVRFLPGVYAGV